MTYRTNDGPSHQHKFNHGQTTTSVGRYLLPRRNLRVVVDPGRVRHAAGLRRDVRRLGDEQRAGDAGALRVVLDREVAVDVRLVRAHASQGREHDAVGELDVADLDRLEERRGVRGGGHASELEAGLRKSGGKERGEAGLLIQAALGSLGKRSADGWSEHE